MAMVSQEFSYQVLVLGFHLWVIFLSGVRSCFCFAGCITRVLALSCIPLLACLIELLLFPVFPECCLNQSNIVKCLVRGLVCPCMGNFFFPFMRIVCILGCFEQF